MDSTRRSFLCSLAATAVVARSSVAKNIQGDKKERPNIILIMADDMGFSDLGCYGSEILTPNIDRLAHSGIRFTQFYNCARCCPSRASLLTGLDNHSAGVGDMIRDLGPANYQGFLNGHCVTLAEALRPAGYHPLMVGKWHVGEHQGHWPIDRGFERYFGLISGACSYFRLDPGRQMALENEPYVPDSSRFYMTDAFTEHAIGLVDDYGRRQEPYFLYLAYTAPHWPLHAWPEDIAKYRGKYRKGWDRLRLDRYRRQIEMGIVDSKWPLTPRDPLVSAWENVSGQDEQDLRMAVYAAQIDRMDQGIGRVLQKVRDLGQEKNTLVIFLSDNGACHEIVDRGKPGVPPGSADSFMSYGRGWANSSNTPFRLYKHWVHEGGISAPFIASWPDVIKHQDTLFHQPAHIADIMPTVLDIAKASYPQSYRGQNILPLAGKTLFPVFRDRSWEGHESLFWEHEGNRAVRHGKWKLVSRFPDRWELYDMEADRSELKDLAASESTRVQTMAAMYNDWARKCGVIPWSKANQKFKVLTKSTTGTV